MLKKRLLIPLLFFIIVILIFILFFNLLISKLNPHKIVGEGNLKVIHIGETTYLANESQDLTFFTNERVRGYRALEVKVLKGKKYKNINAEKITLNTDDYAVLDKLECLIANNTIVSCDSATQHSPDDTKVIVDLGDGIWLINIDGTQLSDISREGYVELMNKAIEENSELINPIIWANYPVWINNHSIAFTSNRDVFPNKYAASIWTIDISTGVTIKIVDASETSDELQVIYADESQLIIWGGISKNVFHYSLTEKVLSEYKINGVPISVSNNGEILLYNALDQSDSLLPDVSSLELLTGKMTTVKHADKHQIYNGVWNSDNLQFAFYSRNFEQFSAGVFIYDHANQSIKNPALPDILGLIDPQGAISWLNEDELLISADQSSWSIRIK